MLQVVLKEMEIFQKPRDGKGNIFLVEPRGQRGIHCRFGMPGVGGMDVVECYEESVTPRVWGWLWLVLVRGWLWLVLVLVIVLALFGARCSMLDARCCAFSKG